MTKRLPFILSLLILASIPFLVTRGSLSWAADRIPSASASPQEILVYLDGHLRSLQRPETDAWILRLIDRQNRTQSDLDRQINAPEINPYMNRYPFDDLVGMRNIKEPRIRSLIQTVYDNGFKLSTSEGMVYIEIDFPRILSGYGSQASPPVRRYLGIMAAETRRHFAEDAGLVITPDDLAARIVAIERFIGDYPHFSRQRDIMPLYREYRSAYLIGMNNTPAFDYQTNRMVKSFQESYHRTVTRYPGTRLARDIRNYLKVLEQNHFEQTNAVLDYVRGLDQ